jgi:hypothetical protein
VTCAYFNGIALSPLTPGHLATRQSFGQGLQTDGARTVVGQMGVAPRSAAGRFAGPGPARLRGEDPHLRGHPREIGQLPLFQAPAKLLGDPVARIGDDDLAGQESLVAHLIEQVQGDFALGPLPAVLRGDTGRIEPLRRLGPGLGQVLTRQERYSC